MEGKRISSYCRTMFLLAIPVMLEQLFQILLGTVDTYFAGKIHDNAIAGINVTNMYMNMLVTIANALGISVMVLVSRNLGAKDARRANLVVRSAILLGAGLGILVGTVNILISRPVMALLGADAVIIEMGSGYFRIILGSCILMFLTILLSYGMKATRNTHITMAASVAANVVNALLDVLFMQMGLGITGLALATMLSRLLNLVILLVVYFSGRFVLHLHFKEWGINGEVMKELVTYTIPTALTHLSARFCILLHGSLILRLGSGYYVANSIATQIDDYACIPSAGFEAATATMVGNSVGAKQIPVAKKYAEVGFFATAILMTAIGGVLAIFSRPLAAIFTQTEEIQIMISQILVFMAAFQWTSSFSHIMTSAVQGTGNAKFPLYVTLLGNIVMRLGLGFVLAYFCQFYLIGIWIGIVMDFLLRGTLLTIYLKKGAWQKIKVDKSNSFEYAK